MLSLQGKPLWEGLRAQRGCAQAQPGAGAGQERKKEFFLGPGHPSTPSLS